MKYQIRQFLRIQYVRLCYIVYCIRRAKNKNNSDNHLRLKKLNYFQYFKHLYKWINDAWFFTDTNLYHNKKVFGKLKSFEILD